MKKILTLATLLAIGQFALGQGSLLFINNSATLISTNSAPGGPATGLTSPAGNSYYFALFSAPPGTVDTAAFVFTGLYATNRMFAGAMGSPGAVEVTGVPVFSTASFLVRGWLANIGTSYDAVTTYLANPMFDAWYGESAIGTLTVRGIDIGSPNLFGITPGQIPGFNLDQHGVPEPSSFALVGLGAAALWLSYRRSP